jgi:hypothetical protein
MIGNFPRCPHQPGIPMVGVGGRPWFDMAPLLPAHDRRELHRDLCLYSAVHPVQQHDLWYYSPPPEGTTGEFGEFWWLTEADAASRLTELDPEGRVRAGLMGLMPRQRAAFLSLMLGTSRLMERSMPLKPAGLPYDDLLKMFPRLSAFLGALPMDIDVAGLLVYHAHAPLPPHRDKPQEPHRQHVLLMNFGPRPRRQYVYDEIAGVRHYVTTDAWIPNVHDYHGGEAVPFCHYTLRVSGTFHQRALDAMGCPDGWITPRDWIHKT